MREEDEVIWCRRAAVMDARSREEVEGNWRLQRKLILARRRAMIRKMAQEGGDVDG